MRSVYDLTMDRFSTFKKRDVVLKRMIDYIFYKDHSFQLEQSLDLLDSSDIETNSHLENGLPCGIYGSDHIHLYSVLSFV